jgi:hypothetical protein
MSECDCPDCRDWHHDNPDVHACVAALVCDFSANAFCRVPHQDKTIDGIRAVIRTGFGPRAANAVRITVH